MITIGWADGVYLQKLSSDELIPPMTDYTTPSGTVLYSTEYNTAYRAWKTYDRTQGGIAILLGTGTADRYLGYRFPTPVVVKSYSMRYTNLREWYFQGSNDGTNWTTLDTNGRPDYIYGNDNTHYGNIVNWNLMRFNIDNTTAFEYYRIFWNKDRSFTYNGGSWWDFLFNAAWNESHIGEMQMYSVETTNPFVDEPHPEITQVPTMTDYTIPEGTVFYSGTEYTGSFRAYNAFNDNSDWFATQGVDPADRAVGYRFPVPVVIKSYYLKGTNLRAWYFQGSNDGTNWTTLDTNGRPDSDYGDNATAYNNIMAPFTINIANTTAYYYYRLYWNLGRSFGSGGSWWDFTFFPAFNESHIEKFQMYTS